MRPFPGHDLPDVNGEFRHARQSELILQYLEFVDHWHRACVRDSVSTARTLIADDQPDVVEALRLLLKTEGYQTEAAQSPAAVLEKLQSGPYDVLLMDLNYTRDTTSGKEGLDLLARIRAIDKTLPVIAMTAWGSVELAVEAMRRGVSDFVLKPWENSRLLGTLRKQIEKGRRRRKKLRQRREEFEEARAIGQALLPRTLPQLPGISITATSRAARTLSGDYFDGIELGPNRVAVSIADVIGKGVPAALLMSNVQASVRALAGAAPAELAASLNASVRRNSTPGKFVTFFYAELEGNRVSYVNAGHCPPLLIRANGEIERLEAGGSVLGVFVEWSYEQGDVTLAPGDRLVLYTDGITEASNAASEEFGEERLIEMARCGAADDLPARVFEAVEAFSGKRAEDDATLLLVAAY